MPTIPTLTSNWNWRAAPPSRVKIAVPLPYGLSLMSVQRLLVGPDAHDRQHRPEDLVAVGVHAGLDVVDQRTPEEEAVGPPYSGCSRPSATTVAPCSAALSRYEATLSRCCRGDERAHLGARVRARARP